MDIRRIAATLLVGALTAPACPAFAACTLGKLAELPVTMSGALPMVTAQINGADARFIADDALGPRLSPRRMVEVEHALRHTLDLGEAA